MIESKSVKTSVDEPRICYRLSMCLCLVLAGSGWIVSGCASSMPARIDVSYDRQYQDIPVPFEFEYDRKESWAYTRFENEPLNMRSCVLVYWGDRPVTELRSWYREQMQKHDWVYGDTDVEANRDRLTFSKGREKAEIELRRMLSDVSYERITKVTADIGVR